MSVSRNIGLSLNDIIGHKEWIPNPDKRSNTGRLLFEIFVWQEIERLAANRLKLAWEAAQADDEGICDADDALRKRNVGMQEVCSSDSFALMVELKTPATRLDTDKFYAALAKTFKTTLHRIKSIAEDCKVENKPSLTKAVVERV